MRAWIFQGNPDTFDIDGYFTSRPRVSWSVKQEHLASEMAVGDLVYFWRAMGSERDPEVSGVVAAGVIAEEPRVYAEEKDARQFWKTADGFGPALRVAIDLTKVANKKQVLKRAWFGEDPVLSELRILRMRNETNYLLDPVHAERLAALWANTGRDFDRNDCIACLWAYDQTFGGELSIKPGSPVADVALLIGRAVSSVESKVLNFRALDPRRDGTGRPAGGEATARAWAEFFDADRKQMRSAALTAEFKTIWTRPAPAGLQPPPRPTYRDFGDAPNDDPAELAMFARKVRRGQAMFRAQLLRAYGGKCCISGWVPDAVLEAAHIEEHSNSGLNSQANGLLLRSDLHALFDEGLLRIDPERMVVVLGDLLRDTQYWELEGRRLRPPSTGAGPSRDLLLARWNRSP